MSRLEPLYRQAVRAKWLPESEQNARNFIAAAIRATSVLGDPVRVFVGIVKRQLWHHVSQAQENRALDAFARHERKTGQRFGAAPSANGLQSEAVHKLVSELAAEVSIRDSKAEVRGGATEPSRRHSSESSG
ncbi:MAG: hypothetical protein KDD69_20190 [Bdellovibrionales bacterium]|nr:hypothetical protein [Bdellovibrionales bacterium]